MILAVGTLVVLLGGFLFFVSVGTNGRTAKSFASRINFHSFSARISGYYGGLKRGGASLKASADHFMTSFWEEPGGTAEAARNAEEAKREYGEQDWSSSDNGENGDGDSFGKYYSKNYGGGSGMDPSSWVDNSEGGASFAGGSSGGSSAARPNSAPGGTPRSKQQAAAPARPFASASGTPGKPGPDLRNGFGSPAGGSSKTSAQRQLASLPARSGSQGQALQYGGGMPAAGGKSENRLNGMSGSQARSAGELDGAAERSSGGGRSSFNAKMSGGAGSVGGGSSGGSVPAASSPANVSGGGSPAAAGPGGASFSVSGGAPDMGMGALYDAQDDDADLLKSVVSETQNGRDAKYLSPDDAKAAPDETMLKSGAVAVADKKSAEVTPDPTNLTELSPERKLELKKSIHVFMKRIQNRFGAMADIKTTSCASTLDLCKEHGVTGDYLTMKTQNGYKLDLGVKYIKTQWRRYTIDFEKPAATSVKPK